MNNFTFLSRLLILAIGLLFVSCSLFRKNLAKRYRNVSENIFRADPSETADKFVTVDVVSKLVIQTSNTTPVYNLLSLTPQGQGELIKAIDSKSTSLTMLIDQVTTNFTFNKEPKQNIKIIGNTLYKSLNFTVDRKFAVLDSLKENVVFNTRADRVDFLELRMEIPEQDPVVFNTWDRFVTKFANLNLGHVTQSSQFSASLNLNANIGRESIFVGTNATESFDSNKEGNSLEIVGPSNGNTITDLSTGELLRTGKVGGSSSDTKKNTSGLGASGNLTYSDKYETSLDLRSRIIDLSGSLSDKKISIRQEGGPGIDLSGTQTVLLEYKLEDDWAVARYIKFKQLFSASIPIAPGSLVKDYLTVIFPNLTKDIVGLFSYQFLYRQVNAGSKHIPEARHKVKYRFGHVGIKAGSQPLSVKLIKREDIRPKSFEITNAVGTPLKFFGDILLFETALDAENFLHYLGAIVSTSGTVANCYIGSNPVNSTLFSSLTIKTKQL